MTQIATVEKILPGGMAEISVPRKSACGHDCEECAGCGVSGASVRAVARNDARAEVGQKVVVESSTKNLLGVMLLVYLLPIMLFLVGYFATGALESEGLRYAVAIAAFSKACLVTSGRPSRTSASRTKRASSPFTAGCATSSGESTALPPALC